MPSYHCNNFRPAPVSRRDMLKNCAMGFGAVALNTLFQDDLHAAVRPNPLLPKQPHFAPKAKNVIFLYMDGGPSQVDTFDYKPLLEKYNGQDPRKAMGKLEPTQFNNIGKVMKSPWNFQRKGQSGIWVSDLFPHVSKHIDDLCVVKSMVSNFPEHTSANYFLHTGSGLQGRPSMGAWFGYGLGSDNQDLPGFVVLNGGLIPPGGLDCFGSGFLPASYQGSVFNPNENPIDNIRRREPSEQHQKNKLSLLEALDRQTIDRYGSVDKLESAVTNYETAYRMQTAVPELTDLSSESEITKKMYGFDAQWKGTRSFAKSCLIARRLVERGVRFIELTCPGGNGDRWDQHGGLKDGHGKNSASVDQPIGALITDLKSRGLFDSTLLVWTGEFGRTPFAQGGNGRDHNPFGFSLWMAGGGIKGGMTYGETDEWGYKAVSHKVEIHDLHATMLHLLGVVHTRSTFRFSSRDMRLTDVHGHVIKDILA
ncbi:MAG: DUF1501 domain-containing protein [Verrucomicrobiota bacterium]